MMRLKKDEEVLSLSKKISGEQKCFKINQDKEVVVGVDSCKQQIFKDNIITKIKEIFFMKFSRDEVWDFQKVVKYRVKVFIVEEYFKTEMQ